VIFISILSSLPSGGEDCKRRGWQIMKRFYFLVTILGCLGIIGYMASEAIAVDAYFDSEISTSLEGRANTGTLLIRMIDEDVPPILAEVNYEQTINVEIILDASKTMEEPDINGIRKFDIAQSLVSILVKYFPSRDTRFALRVLGTKYPNNCLDSELIVPFSRENGQQVLDAVKQIRPKGLSPLAFSLRQVLKDFEGTKGTKLVFIITDALETCDVDPVDTCTVTMDLLDDAEFEGRVHILGINTVYADTVDLLSCLSARGRGTFLDSNRDGGPQLARLIRDSSQIGYSISRVLDTESLAEGKILGLLNRRVGDATGLASGSGITGGDTDVLVKPGIIRKEETTTLEIQEIQVVELPDTELGYSTHELPPGIYKIEFITTPPLVSYFTIDQQQELTIGLVRSGIGFDLYDRAHFALGNRYYDNGQIEDALAEYQKVLAFDDRNVDVHLNLGIIYQDILGDNEKAAFHYRTYLELQGPRNEEVAGWLREARGLPTVEEELEQKRLETEQQKQQEEAERLAREEEAKVQEERQKSLSAYNEIRTANPDIIELAEESVISGDRLEVIVSLATTDSKAEKVALDVGNRMHSLLNRNPEIVVYRENNREVPLSQASYDESQQQYIIVN
jgi:tetratricopeptide (TPR) repeat protein